MHDDPTEDYPRSAVEAALLLAGILVIMVIGTVLWVLTSPFRPAETMADILTLGVATGIGLLFYASLVHWPLG